MKTTFPLLLILLFIAKDSDRVAPQPDCPLYEQGKICFKEKDYKNSIRYFELSLKTGKLGKEKESRAYLNIGRNHLKEKQLDAAFDYFSQANILALNSSSRQLNFMKSRPLSKIQII